MKVFLSAVLAFAVMSGARASYAQQGAVDQASAIPKAKQTTLGLYLTASDAFHQWLAGSDHVKIIDVRTPEEYVFIGHPEMAWNVPFMFITHEWDEAKGKLVMKPNAEFLVQVTKIVQPTDTILVICRSGQRSAPAVNVLAEAGFKKVFSVVDGVEGDKVEEADSLFVGKRMKNGWKNSGLPWTYDLDPQLVYRTPKE